MGVVLFSGLAVPASDLMQHADLAMYRAKAEGRNTMRFFNPQMQAEVLERLALEQALRQAIEQSQLTLCYQPQVGSTGQIVGVEALVRWHHPQRGLVSPGEFIPLAEEIGLILPLGQWVLQAACKQLAQWAQPAAAGAPGPARAQPLDDCGECQRTAGGPRRFCCPRAANSRNDRGPRRS